MSYYYKSNRISTKKSIRIENFDTGKEVSCQLCNKQIKRVGRKPAKYCGACLTKLQEEYKDK